MKRLKGSKEKTRRQPRKTTKAGKKRIKSKQEKTQRQPRKDAPAAKKRLKAGKKMLRLVAMAGKKRIKSQARIDSKGRQENTRKAGKKNSNCTQEENHRNP
jgi:hypothetical protein